MRAASAGSKAECSSPEVQIAVWPTVLLTKGRSAVKLRMYLKRCSRI
jgi:hypothetical protein